MGAKLMGQFYYFQSILNMISTLSIFFLIANLIPYQKTITIVIVGTNDFHGAAFPTLLTRTDTGEKYNYGGLVYMARIMQIIKEEYPNRYLYFDAGDQFQGSIESSSKVSSGQILNDFYELMGLDGSAFGNHQFDYGPQFLDNFLNGRQSVNLAANLRSQTGQFNFLRKHQSSQVYVLDKGIKIGMIGLTTVETANTSDVFNGKLFPKYTFEEYRDNVIKQSNKLRQLGVSAVLLVSHVGNQCNGSYDYSITTKDTYQNKSQCLHDEISRLIDEIPQGTIDGVVQGHRHWMVHQFYKGIPIMGTISGGFYLNVMHITFDAHTKHIIQKKIEGPIPVCQRVFEYTNKCNYLPKGQIEKAGKLVNWKFHGKQIYAHRQLNAIFKEKWQKLMENYFVEIVKTQIELQIDYDGQNELGNLITNLIHQGVPDADFVLLNNGGFRSKWLPGIIQYQHFYAMFPFSNNLYSFQINGQQLIEMLRISQSGSKAFYQTWGLQQTVKITKDKRKKKFISAKFSNKDQIIKEKQYKGVTVNFLINGAGDDFINIINKTYIPRNVYQIGQFRNLIQPKLKNIGVITKNTLIDKSNPRLILQEIENDIV